MKIILALISSLSLFSCAYRIDKQSGLSNQDFDIPQSKLQASSFKSVYENVLRTSCLSCHDSGKLPLTSYLQVKANLDKISKVVLGDRTMPKSPTPPLTREQLLILVTWIRAGAPEEPQNGNPESPITPLPALTPSYASLKANIFDSKCLHCHSAGGEVARIPLVTKDDFLNSPVVIIDPQNPDESGLLIVLDPVFKSKKFMPPPKSGYTPVTSEQLETVRRWIALGTPD
jgi:hypothetical protein